MPAIMIQLVPSQRSSAQPSPMHVATEKKIESPAAYAMPLRRVASCSSRLSSSIRLPNYSFVTFVESSVASVVKEPELNHRGHKGIHKGHRDYFVNSLRLN